MLSAAASLILVGPKIAFGAGPSEDRMTPVGLAALVISTVLVLALPRKWVIVPLLLSIILVPGQQFVVGGVHLFANRIVCLLGCGRFLFNRGSARSPLVGGFTQIDKLFLTWAICRSLAFVLLYREGAAVVNQVGFLWDALCGYFLFRCVVRDAEDIRRAAKTFVPIAVVVAGCMVYEHYMMTNPFGVILGGQIVPHIREGKIRCRGPFEQEIIASVFGGSLVPSLALDYLEGQDCYRDRSGSLGDHYPVCIVQYRDICGCVRDWGALSLAAEETHAQHALGTGGGDRGSRPGNECAHLVHSGAR